MRLRSTKYEDERVANNLNRITNLSDGVVAIVITLLVFDLMPIIPPQDWSVFWGSAINPRLSAFVISFIIIGLYWIHHHKMFSFIVRYDDGLVWINLLLLLSLALLPFSTKISEIFWMLSIATIFNTIVIIIVGSLASLLWVYASRNFRLIDEATSLQHIRHVKILGVVVPVIFVVALPFQLITTAGAFIITVSAPIIYAAISWRFREHSTEALRTQDNSVTDKANTNR